MTEIISAENTPKRGPKFGKLKKRSIRIDMTPMVDLGFLLITFFIFTSTMNEPSSMRLIMPKDGTDMPIKKSGALTILPAENDNVYYYEDFFEPKNLRRTSFKGIRDVILNKKRSTPAENLFVIIKPSKFSKYRNVVDILDEMVISDIKRYALAKITGQEESLVK
jgi:biopolymer transport protein ExbD